VRDLAASMRLIQFDKTQDVREPSKWIRVGTEVSSKESNSQLQWKLIGSQYSDFAYFITARAHRRNSGRSNNRSIAASAYNDLSN
jgi:hypothetical protein